VGILKHAKKNHWVKEEFVYIFASCYTAAVDLQFSSFCIKRCAYKTALANQLDVYAYLCKWEEPALEFPCKFTPVCELVISEEQVNLLITNKSLFSVTLSRCKFLNVTCETLCNRNWTNILLDKGWFSGQLYSFLYQRLPVIKICSPWYLVFWSLFFDDCRIRKGEWLLSSQKYKLICPNRNLLDHFGLLQSSL